MVAPLNEAHVTFCALSDVCLATSRDSNSYQGALVIVIDWRMLANQQVVVSPVAWSSKKIARVVRSTLIAEVMSLYCHCVARWADFHRSGHFGNIWEWLKNPAANLASPQKFSSRLLGPPLLLPIRALLISL